MVDVLPVHCVLGIDLFGLDLVVQGLVDLDNVLVWFVVLLVEVSSTGQDVDGYFVVLVVEDLLEVDQNLEIDVVQVVKGVSVDSWVFRGSVLFE